MTLQHQRKQELSEQPLYCAAHPTVETGLRCGSCEKPICPKCLVHTPTGAWCRQCARITSNPVYQVSANYYLRAVGAAVTLAVGGGVVWAVLRGVPFISFFIALGLGIAVGEGISRAANRKRGRGLQAIAVVSLISSYFIGRFFRAALIHQLSGTLLWDWVFSIDVFTILFLAVGAFYAIARLK